MKRLLFITLISLMGITFSNAFPLNVLPNAGDPPCHPKHPVVDSALIMATLSDSMVIWYFRLSNYDTIYIISNHFTENVSVTHHEEDEKTILFVSRESAPSSFVLGRRPNIVLEVLGFGWESKNRVQLSIGRDTNNRATIRAVRRHGRWRIYAGSIT